MHFQADTRPPPYSLTVRGAAEHFGFAPQSLYDMISGGKLIQGYHYLKIGKKVLIIRERFIEWLYQQDPFGREHYGGKAER